MDIPFGGIVAEDELALPEARKLHFKFLKISLGFNIWTLKAVQSLFLFNKYFVNNSTARCFYAIIFEIHQR